MDGLKTGMMVNVVMKDGTLRPFLIIAVTDSVSGVISGQLFCANTDYFENLPFPLLPTIGIIYATGVTNDPTVKTPGTWSFVPAGV
jgi:hypothetical protein